MNNENKKNPRKLRLKLNRETLRRLKQVPTEDLRAVCGGVQPQTADAGPVC